MALADAAPRKFADLLKELVPVFSEDTKLVLISNPETLARSVEDVCSSKATLEAAIRAWPERVPSVYELTTGLAMYRGDKDFPAITKQALKFWSRGNAILLRELFSYVRMLRRRSEHSSCQVIEHLKTFIVLRQRTPSRPSLHQDDTLVSLDHAALDAIILQHTRAQTANSAKEEDDNENRVAEWKAEDEEEKKQEKDETEWEAQEEYYEDDEEGEERNGLENATHADSIGHGEDAGTGADNKTGAASGSRSILAAAGHIHADSLVSAEALLYTQISPFHESFPPNIKPETSSPAPYIRTLITNRLWKSVMKMTLHSGRFGMQSGAACMQRWAPFHCLCHRFCNALLRTMLWGGALNWKG